MSNSVVRPLFYAVFCLVFAAYYAGNYRGKVPVRSYWMIVIGFALGAIAMGAKAWVCSLPYPGLSPQRVLSMPFTYIGLAAAVLTVVGALSDGFVEAGKIRYDKSVMAPHKRLAVAYLALVVIGGLPITGSLRQMTGLSFRSFIRSLGPRHEMLLVGAIFAMIVIQSVLLAALWASRRAESVVRSKWSLIVPPFVTLVVGAAFYLPIWLRIQSLLADGKIWPSDVHSSVLLAGFWMFVSVTLSLFFWHATLGSGTYANRQSKPDAQRTT